MRHGDDGGAVDLDHGGLACGVQIAELAEFAETGVVDQQRGPNSLPFREVEDAARGVGIFEIGVDDFNFRAEFRGEFAETFEATGGEHEIHTARGEFGGDCLSDAGTGPGNEGPLAFPARSVSAHLRPDFFDMFSKRKRPLLPPVAKSISPSPSISATGICMPPPVREP